MRATHHSDLWTVGGFDPSGGAGITADLAAFQRIGLQATSLVTTVTAQSPLEFRKSYPVTREAFGDLWETASNFVAPTVIKMGMFSSEEIIEEAAFRMHLLGKSSCKSVIDPVFRASRSLEVGDDSLIHYFKTKLLPHAYVLTPNAQEAFLLTGVKVVDRDSQIAAAKLLHVAGVEIVIIKGGHLADEDQSTSSDYYSDQFHRFFMTGPRQNKEVHGTGCVFASALAAYLYTGEEPHNAAIKAKHFVSAAIETAVSRCDEPSIIQFPSIAVDQKQFPVVEFHGTPLAAIKESPSCIADLGLYGIVNRSQQVEEYAKRGLKTLQLRIKDSTEEHIRLEVKKSVEISEQFGMQLFVNDYWQVAIEEKAYGIHLGQEDLQKLTREQLNEIKAADLRVGISTHEHLELARALAIKPSYVALGPIYKTTCKSMKFGPQGLAKIREWSQLTSVPVVAIGGLKCRMIEDIRALGADGLAVISDLPNC